jgi:hypothetical protein
MPATPLSTNQMDNGGVGLTAVLHKIKRATKELNVKRSSRAKRRRTTRTTRTTKGKMEMRVLVSPIVQFLIFMMTAPLSA